MENEIEKKLEETFETLPKDVQEALSSVDVSQKIMEVAKTHGILLDAVETLSDETTMVMLGLENPNEFPGGIEAKLGVSKEKAEQIAKDIDTQIFEPIRESLKKIYSEEEGPGAGERPAQMSPLSEISRDDILPGQNIPQGSLIEQKLGGAIKTTREEVPFQVPTRDEKKYIVDPYREPAE